MLHKRFSDWSSLSLWSEYGDKTLTNDISYYFCQSAALGSLLGYTLQPSSWNQTPKLRLHFKPFPSWFLNGVFRESWRTLWPNSCINIYVRWILLMLEKLMDDRLCGWGRRVWARVKEAPIYNVLFAAVPSARSKQSLRLKVNLPQLLARWNSQWVAMEIKTLFRLLSYDPALINYSLDANMVSSAVYLGSHYSTTREFFSETLFIISGK